MSRLHIYTVHIDPSLPHPYEEAEFVREGFNWRAFVFTGLWMLYNKLWLAALAVFAVNGALLYAALNAAHQPGFFALELGWRLIVGYLANDALRAKLRSKGYVTADIVTGDSELRAEQRFFDRYFSDHRNAPAFVS